MNGVAKNMDSVFDNSAAADIEFDTFFDQEDSLIDTVNGVNEAGDPLTGVDFEDLHQTDDDATVKDVKDVESDDEKMGAPDPEGTHDNEQLDVSVKGEVDKESDADKFHGNAEEDYQEDKTKEPEPNEDSVEDTIEKVIESTGNLDSLLLDESEDVCEGCGKPKNECTCAPQDESCKKEGADCEEPSAEDGGEEATVESFEQEIQNEAAADSDVEAAVDADLEDDSDDVDAVEEKKVVDNKYEYDLSDEDLIDSVMNGSDDE